MSTIQPTTVMGALSESTISTRSAMLMDRPYMRKILLAEDEIDGNLQYDIKGDFLGWSTMMGIAQVRGGFQQISEYHVEDETGSPWVFINQVAVAPAPLGNLVVTISFPYGGGGTQSSAAVKTSWWVGGVIADCIAVNTGTANAHTMTLKPRAGSFATYAQDTPIMELAAGYAELEYAASRTMQRGLVAYDHHMQDSHEAFECTNYALYAAPSWFDLPAGDNPWSRKGLTRSWDSDGLNMTWKSFLTKLAFGQIMGDRNRNSARAAGGASYTDGMLPSIKAMGNHLVVPPQGYTIEDFREIGKIYVGRAGGGSADKTLGGGYQWKGKIDDAIRPEMIGRSNSAYGESYLKLDWKGLNVSGVNYTFGRVPFFDADHGLGQIGYSNNMICIPGESDKAKWSDGSTGPLASVCYFNPESTLVGVTAGDPFKYSQMRGHDFSNETNPRTQLPNGYYGEVSVKYMAKYMQLSKYIFAD